MLELEQGPEQDLTPQLEAEPAPTAPLIEHILSTYRKDRAPVVVQISRIDHAIALLTRSNLAGMDVTAITRSDIADYRAAREAIGILPQTVHRELSTLRAAVRLAHREGVIAKIPPIPMPPRGSPPSRALTADETRRLLRAARMKGPRCELFVRLFLATGARPAAIVELEWSRVDLDQQIIDLRSSSPLAPRMKHRAVVPITREMVVYLRAYRDRPPAPRTRGRRFTLPPSRVVGVTLGTARQQLTEAAAAAGLAGVTPRTLRHTVATHLLRHVPLVIASRMLGHSSVSVTSDIYGHLLTRDLEPAADALDQLVRTAFTSGAWPEECEPAQEVRSLRVAVPGTTLH